MKFVTANFSRVIVMYHGRVLLDGQAREVFAQTDTLRRSFVTPPPVTRVAQGAGLKETVFSVPAFINAIAQERNHRG
jgi:energy-coupling factor transport system ATP-binding protein